MTADGSRTKKKRKGKNHKKIRKNKNHQNNYVIGVAERTSEFLSNERS